MIHNDYGLLVYIDGHPSDTLGERPNESPTVAGIVTNVDQPIEWLSQYKQVRVNRRLKLAAQIVNSIEQGEFEINAFSCFTSFREIERYGSEVLGCLPREVVERKGEIFKFRDFELPKDIAIYAAWYATAIIFIGQRAAQWANALDVRRVQLICDHFPGNSTEVMQAIMAATLLCPSNRMCWDESKERYGVEFGVSNLGQVASPNGDLFDHKDYVQMQIVDWIAHAHYAYTNPDGFWDGNKKRDEAYRLEMQKLWIAISKQKRAISLELGPRMTPDLDAMIQNGPFVSEKYS